VREACARECVCARREMTRVGVIYFLHNQNVTLSRGSTMSSHHYRRAVWCAMIMVFTLLSVSSFSSFVEAGVVRRALVPGVPVRGEQLAFADGLRGNTYALEGVDGDMAYEVKVSYTATNPARVWVDIERDVGGIREESTSSSRETRETSASRNELRRRLLNVEKTVLSRDFLRARSGTTVFVTVRAEREGVYWEGEAGAPSALTYDIALGPLLASGKYGEIPQESIPVIALAVGCVVVAIVLAPYVANRLIWRAYDDEKKKDVK